MRRIAAATDGQGSGSGSGQSAPTVSIQVPVQPVANVQPQVASTHQMPRPVAPQAMDQTTRQDRKSVV